MTDDKKQNAHKDLPFKEKFLALMHSFHKILALYKTFILKAYLLRGS